MKKRLWILFPFVFLLTACGKGTDTNTTEKETLILAVFEDNSEVSKQVAIFNEKNDEYRIEIQKYERSSLSETDGIAQIQREIMSGEGPDMINYGSEYSTSDIVGEYTENLTPYLQQKIEQEGDMYFTNIINAFCYRESLYAMPIAFTMQTFAGDRLTLGEREHWDITEMMACYEEQSEEMMLYPGETRKDVFGTILSGSIESYIDWSGQKCFFDGEEFKDIMSFSKEFPNELRITEEYSAKQTFSEGGALLLPLKLTNIYDIAKAEFIFGEKEIAYIGFPVERDSGTVINPSDMVFGISINSKDKDTCWEFICQFLEVGYQEEIKNGFPISRNALENKLLANREVEYVLDQDGKQCPVAKEEILFEGEDSIELYNVTEQQANTLLHLIDSAQICNTVDYALYNILLEEIDSYFSDDKMVEETADIIQKRVSMYVSERVQ